MVDACYFADVVDVVRHLGDGRHRNFHRREFGFRGSALFVRLRFAHGDVHTHHGGLHHLGHVAVHEAGHECDHDHAAIGWQLLQDVVGHIARNAAYATRASVREDDGALRHLQCGGHGNRRRVRQVHHHAQPVHLAHHVFAEGREPIHVRRHHGGGVGPLEMHVVRQRHVAHAEVVIGAQQRQGVFDGVATFNAEHAGNLAGLAGLTNVIGSGCQREHVAVSANDFAGDGNLFQFRASEVAVLLFPRNVDTPELRLNTACTQAWNVRLAGRAGAQVVLRHHAVRRFIVADGPGQIVVAVEQRGFGKQGAGMDQRRIFVSTACGMSNAHGAGGGEQQGGGSQVAGKAHRETPQKCGVSVPHALVYGATVWWGLGAQQERPGQHHGTGLAIHRFAEAHPFGAIGFVAQEEATVP